MESHPVVESTGAIDWAKQGEYVVLTPHLAPTGGMPEFERIAHRPVTSIIEDLRRLVEARELGHAADVVTLLVVEPATSDVDTRAAHEGLFEALRGVVGSLTLELAASGWRLNLVRTRSVQDAESTLRFLGSEEAGFVAGSTVDLCQEVVS